MYSLGITDSFDVVCKAAKKIRIVSGPRIIVDFDGVYERG
jgi:hypothetical protein